MVAGLSTGSIIAMAMDFSIWPRYYTPPPPAQQQQTPSKSEADQPAQRTSPSPTTELVDKVPDETSAEESVEQGTKKDQIEDEEEPAVEATEQASTAIVNVVPDDDEGTSSADNKTEETKTSSLVHPVPADDDESEDIPKTLLQTAQLGSKDP